MIEDLLLRTVVLVGWAFLGFFLVTNIAYYVPLTALGFIKLNREMRDSHWDPISQMNGSPFLPGIAIISPVYNESEHIVGTTWSYINTDYPDKEVVLVNDGSTDDTLEILRTEFDLEPIDADLSEDIPCEPIREVYQSKAVEKLYVIDKKNGGIGDAENAGLQLTEMQLFCVIDSDSFLHPNSLRRLVRPFLEYPEETIGVGGTLHVANVCTFNEGNVTSVSIPKNPLLGVQIIEYLRAFYSNRLGLARIGSVQVISGGCGMFKTSAIHEVGGFHRETKAEDMEIVIRLHRYFRDAGRSYRIDQVAEAVSWTDVPERFRSLGSQRRRWYQGILEVLTIHRHAIGRPRYGVVGLVGLPGFALAEGGGRLVEGTSYVLILLALWFGIVTIQFVAASLILFFSFAVLLAWIGVFSELVSYRHYHTLPQVAVLLLYGIVENIGYRQWRVFVGIPGIIDVLRDDISWRSLDPKQP